MSQFNPHTALEKILPLGTPKFSEFLPDFVRFIGQQMIASADELETEKQPVETEASNEPEAEERTEKEAEATEEPKEKEPPPSESHLKDHDEEKQEAST